MQQIGKVNKMDKNCTVKIVSEEGNDIYIDVNKCNRVTAIKIEFKYPVYAVGEGTLTLNCKITFPNIDVQHLICSEKSKKFIKECYSCKERFICFTQRD